MSQKQRVVDLVFLDESKRKAVATGNNAAWRCECDRGLPLIGCSGSKQGPSAGTTVECPECKRKYFVVPADKNRGRVVEVREIKA
jgi:hypothetical protein